MWWGSPILRWGSPRRGPPIWPYICRMHTYVIYAPMTYFLELYSQAVMSVMHMQGLPTCLAYACRAHLPGICMQGPPAWHTHAGPTCLAYACRAYLPGMCMQGLPALQMHAGPTCLLYACRAPAAWHMHAGPTCLSRACGGYDGYDGCTVTVDRSSDMYCHAIIHWPCLPWPLAWPHGVKAALIA